MRSVRASAAVLAAAAVLALGPLAARAEDPGRWLLTGASSIPTSYWQGLPPDPAEANVYFIEVFEGTVAHRSGPR